MNDKLIATLKEYWLNEKEANLYLITLELWSAPASTIARRAWLKRVTAYVILQDMVRKWVLNEIQHKWAKSFSVVDPDQLVAQWRVKCQTFEQALPEFAALADVWGNKPRIQYFEWTAGVKAMYEDLLTSVDTIYSFLWVSSSDENILEYLYNDFLPRRIKSNIFAQVLVWSNDLDLDYAWRDEWSLKETRIISNELFHMDVEINIYWPWKVWFALFSKDEMSWFIVHSHKMSDSLLSIFKVLRENTALDSNKKE